MKKSSQIFLRENAFFHNFLRDYNYHPLKSPINIFKDFQTKLNEKLIKTPNAKLDEELQKFSFDIFMDDKKDFKHLLEKNNDSHIIIIDKYIDCESANNYDDDFYIICFEYSLIIIQSKIISYFLPFFNKNKDSTTYCYNEEIKDELQQITNDNIFQFSTSKFFDKISNFLCKFGIYEKSNKVKNFWMTIRRSVVGFYL